MQPIVPSTTPYKALYVVQAKPSFQQMITSKAVLITAYKAASAVYILNSMKAFWFFKPIQLFIQGQWWSIAMTHLPQIEQWWVWGGFLLLHFRHYFSNLVLSYYTVSFVNYFCSTAFSGPVYTRLRPCCS